MQWFGGRLFEAEQVRAVQVESEQSEGDRPIGVDRPLDNAALRFGASVFTTMRVYGQRLDDPRSQFTAHCDRLTQSLHTFGWPSPNWASIYKGCQQLCSHYPVIRITVFPDGQEWITGRALPPQLTQQQQDGVACWLAPPTYARSLPAHKTGNYLACWLARQQAQKLGGQEAILTNVDGDWLETATGNLWGWADGQWWTPLESDAGDELGIKYKDFCLPGLMRSQVQRILRDKGQVVNGQWWNKSVVSRFEAIAYTNCVVELLPIHTIFDGHTTLEYNTHHASLKALRQWIDGSYLNACDS